MRIFGCACTNAFASASPCTLGLAFLLTAAVTGLGCGDDSEGAGIVPMQQFSEQYRGATCEHLVACNLMPDTQTCLSVIGTDPRVAQSIASTNAGVLTYDAVLARACIDALRSASCEDRGLIPRGVREACDGVFGSRSKEGEPCFHAAECAGLDARCEGACDDKCCEGTCMLDQGRAKLGEPCDMRECTEDSYCKSEGMDVPQCAAKVGPGDSCGDNSDACPAGYGCDPSTNTCFKQAVSGAPCNPDLQVDGCAALGQFCHPEQRKCVALPGPGQPCASNGYLGASCAPGYAWCDPTMVCQTLPKEGEPCTNNRCMGGVGAAGLALLLSCSTEDGEGVCVAASPEPACER